MRMVVNIYSYAMMQGASGESAAYVFPAARSMA